MISIVENIYVQGGGAGRLMSARAQRAFREVQGWAGRVAAGARFGAWHGAPSRRGGWLSGGISIVRMGASPAAASRMKSYNL